MAAAPPTAVESLLAERLAFNDGWLIHNQPIDHANADLRKDYLDLARTTLAVIGGPTEAQQEVAALTAEARELTRQRDRYRDAWLSARRRVHRAEGRTK